MCECNKIKNRKLQWNSLSLHTYKVKVDSIFNSIMDDVIFVSRICASVSFSEDKTL